MDTERVSITGSFINCVQYQDREALPGEICFYDVAIHLDGKGYNARFLIHTADDTPDGPRETQLMDLKPDDGETSDDVDLWAEWGIDGDLGEELHEQVLTHYLEEEAAFTGQPASQAARPDAGYADYVMRILDNAAVNTAPPAQDTSN